LPCFALLLPRVSLLSAVCPALLNSFDRSTFPLAVALHSYNNRLASFKGADTHKMCLYCYTLSTNCNVLQVKQKKILPVGSAVRSVACAQSASTSAPDSIVSEHNSSNRSEGVDGVVSPTIDSTRCSLSSFYTNHIIDYVILSLSLSVSPLFLVC